MPKHSNRRVQNVKPVSTTYGVFSPEGRAVHTCKNRSEAVRVALKFEAVDRVRHTVHPIQRYNVRDGF